MAGSIEKLSKDLFIIEISDKEEPALVIRAENITKATKAAYNIYDMEEHDITAVIDLTSGCAANCNLKNIVTATKGCVNAQEILG